MKLSEEQARIAKKKAEEEALKKAEEAKAAQSKVANSNNAEDFHRWQDHYSVQNLLLLSSQ